jgi:hypothetical protein
MGGFPKPWRSVIVAVSVLSAACTQPSARHQANNPPPVPADVQQVCAEFVITALSVDAATDTGPADARQRATRALGDPTLHDNPSAQGRDPDWPLLIEHRAHVTVTVRPVTDDPPPITGDQAAAGVEVSRVATGRDGWRQPLPSAVAYCSLRRTPTGWKVAALTLSDNGTTREQP